MRHILLLLAALATLSVWAQDDSTRVRLTITGAGRRAAMHGATDKGWERTPANVGVIECAWLLTEPRLVEADLDNAALVKSHNGKGYIPTKSSRFLFIASPKSRYEQTAEINADYVNFYPTGDAENETLAAFTRAYNPLQNAYVNIALRKELSREERARLQEPLEHSIDSLRRAFLDKHASSIAGLWLMNDMLVRSQISVPDCERYFLTVSDRYKEHSYYASLAGRIDGYKKAAEGSPAPDINTRRTTDGKPFSLASLRGRYVIIDFWGTWCGACLAGMPALKAFAEKHADRLSLVGICCGTNVRVPDIKAWIAERHPDWQWQQVVNGKGDDDYVLKYNVQGYPTKILISPRGVILKRFTGEDKTMYAEMEKLLAPRVK